MIDGLRNCYRFHIGLRNLPQVGPTMSFRIFRKGKGNQEDLTWAVSGEIPRGHEAIQNSTAVNRTKVRLFFRFGITNVPENVHVCVCVGCVCVPHQEARIDLKRTAVVKCMRGEN